MKRIHPIGPLLATSLLAASLLLACGDSSSGGSNTGDGGSGGTLPGGGDGGGDAGSGGAGGDGGEGGSGGEEEPQQGKVRGTVTSAFEQPIAGIKVRLNGRPVVTTDEEGRFTVSDVTRPYELTVFDDSPSNGPVAHVFVGLSTWTPKVIPFFIPLTNDGGVAKVQGSIGTIPAGETAKICVEGLTRAVMGCTDLSAGTGNFMLDDVRWSGDSLVDLSMPVRLHAFRFKQDAAEVLTSIEGYGTAETTVVAGETQTVDVELQAPPATTTVTAALGLPEGPYEGGLLLGVQLSPWFSFPFGGMNKVTEATFLAPKLPGATYTILGGAASDEGGLIMGWKTGVAAAGSGQVKLLPVARLVSPEDGATGVTTSTPLIFDTAPGTMLTAHCKATGAPDAPTFIVSTIEDTLTLPDLTSLGLPLPAAVKYDCTTAATTSPTQGANAMVTGVGASGAFLRLIMFSAGLGMDRSGTFSGSGGSWSFTTGE